MKTYQHCHHDQFTEAFSPITGNRILVNLSDDKVFVPADADLDLVKKIGADLPEFWMHQEKTAKNSWRTSPAMRAAYMRFGEIQTMQDFMDAIEAMINAVSENKEPRAQILRALYALTRLWSHGLVAIPPKWTQAFRVNCPITEFTVGEHISWLNDIAAVASVKSERERLRTIGLALRLATSGCGIKELGDLTPVTCASTVMETMGTRSPGLAKSIYTAQLNRYGSSVKPFLADWGTKKFKVRKKSDLTFMWSVIEDPSLESWRQHVADWSVERSAKSGGLKLGEFFLNYLIAYPSVTRNPEEFCRRNYTPPVPYQEWNNDRNKSSRGLFDMNNLASELIDWILDSKLSTPDDYGRPIRSPDHWNPISRLLKKGQAIQTHREAIPTRYINEMIKILTEDDFAWAKKSKTDWVTWLNDETGEWEKVWSPVRVSVMLLKLYLPLRTFQVRVLDSGEADSEIYRDGQWITNDGPLAPTGRKTVRHGFLRRYSDRLSGRVHTGFFVNTNKTQDRGKDEIDKGYEIPWQHEEAIRIVENLLAWQKKYNPIDAPMKWSDLHDSIIVRTGRGEEFGRRGEACFLMRDPCGTYHNEPITDSRIRPFWILLQDELERRVAARGETLPDGSPIIFIDKRHADRNNEPARTVFDLHTLRVSIITALATEGGVPIEILSKCIAGHASILMTLYYVKLGIPYITEKLADAQKRMAVEEKRNFSRFLQSAEYKELESLVASNDSTGLKAIQDNSPGSWVMSDKGICPVGGALCNKGGEKLTANMQLSNYAPAPGGPKNCVRCRFMITGPAFIGGLVAHFNAIGVQLLEASERYRSKEQHIRKLEDEMVAADSEGMPFARLTELNAAYERHERDMNEVDEIALNWHATYRLIERCKAIMASSEGNQTGDLNLVLTGGVSDLETAIEMTTDFDLMNAVCQVANVYPGENVTVANLRRSRILDAMLIRNNRRPVFATLSEDDAVSVGNELVTLLMSRLGKADTAALMDGRRMLESSGVADEAEALLEAKIGEPIRLMSVIDAIRPAKLLADGAVAVEEIE